MKIETKQRLVKCIDHLQNQIKGGPGSGPRPGGGGHSLAAHNASARATKQTGAESPGLKNIVDKAHAFSKAAYGTHSAGAYSSAKKNHQLASQHHQLAVGMLKEKITHNAPRYKISNEANRQAAITMHTEAANRHKHAADSI